MSDSARFDSLIQRVGAQYNVPAALIKAVVARESDFNPYALGTQGDTGLMQVMPDTARALGFSGDQSQLYDPETNITLGAKLLRDNINTASANGYGIDSAISAYNAGFSVERPGDGKRVGDAGTPFINQSYVDWILQRANQYAAAWRGEVPTLAPVIVAANMPAAVSGMAKEVAVGVVASLIVYLLVREL